MKEVILCLIWRRDAQLNDTDDNDNKNSDDQHWGTKHNDAKLKGAYCHNDTKQNDTLALQYQAKWHPNITIRSKMTLRHYDTQHNDTKNNDTKHNDTKHNDTKHNDTKHWA